MGRQYDGWVKIHKLKSFREKMDAHCIHKNEWSSRTPSVARKQNRKQPFITETSDLTYLEINLIHG